MFRFEVFGDLQRNVTDNVVERAATEGSSVSSMSGDQASGESSSGSYERYFRERGDPIASGSSGGRREVSSRVAGRRFSRRGESEASRKSADVIEDCSREQLMRLAALVRSNPGVKVVKYRDCYGSLRQSANFLVSLLDKPAFDANRVYKARFWVVKAGAKKFVVDFGPYRPSM
ncbi:hypothetical protein [Crucivirus-540]|nr:hypothetical protein [Crucivirus-540]